MKVVSRAEWGARPPKYRNSLSIPTAELYLHHAAGAVVAGEDGLSTRDIGRIKSIQNYHMDSQGWSDIAYNYLLDPDGNVFEGRGATTVGGATKGQNSISQAICVMGNYDLQQPSQALLESIAQLVRYGHSWGWWPDRITGGHKDAPGAATSCPGKNLYPKIAEINELAKEDDLPTVQEIAQAVWSFDGAETGVHMQRNVIRAAQNAQAAYKFLVAGSLASEDDIVALAAAVKQQPQATVDALVAELTN